MQIKTSFIAIVFAGFLALGLVSCEKEINDDIKIPPSIVQITQATGTVASYFITNSSTSSYKIPVGFSTVSDKDRTINFTYTSPTGAAQGTQFTGPASIVIPAGKVADTIEVRGLFAGYPTGRKDTLHIGISSPDAPTAAFNNRLTLVMQKSCPVVFADLLGDYTNTREYTSAGAFSYGPYTTVLKNFTSTGATKGEAYIQNIYDDGWGDIKVLFDWADPANYKVSIPSQPTGKGYNVRSTAGQMNTFSSCDQTVSLSIDLVNGSTVTASNYKIILRRS